MQLRWGDCRLDTEARTLERADSPVRVQALAFDLLALLLRNRGRVVSETLLRDELWPGVTVGDASLRQVLKEARRAIGDDGRTQAQIETLRGRGLRFVAPVSVVSGPEATFVGREDVLAILERELDETDAGRGGLTLLSGRAGIGKTSTLLEIAARAEARGWRAIKAWARAGAEADAYSLWIEVAETLGASGLTQASRELPASGGISESNRFARFRAVEDTILRSARERPLLLCLDDLQFADRESLALLRYLAPALHAGRARVLGSHRPLVPTDARTRDLAALAGETSTRTIELRGIDADEMRALVGLRLGTRLDEAAAATLAARTEGSPLLALEAVRALRASGAALEHASPGQIEASVALGLVPLLRRRLAALAPASRRLLHAAAAIGDPFDPELARTAADRTPEELEHALLEAERSALIERQGEATWRFAHPLFAEGVADDLASQGPDVRAALHLRLFEALETSRAPDRFRVARHALHARTLLAPAVVVERLRGAARAAWRMHAVADAESWQRRAVELADEAVLPPLERCDMLTELGELECAASGIDTARVPFDRAARIAREHGDARRLARAALGHAHRGFVLARVASSLDWLRAAHAAPCGDASLDARVAARLGAELLLANPADRSEGERLLREGIARAREPGDALTLGRVLVDQSIVGFSAADLRGALALAHEALSCGRHAGDVEIELRGLGQVATLQLEQGDRAGVEGSLAACESFVRRAPIPYGRAVTHGIAAMCALLDGRLDDAAAAIGEAERHARTTASRGLLLVSGLQRFLLARERCDLLRVLPALDQACGQFPNQPGLGALAGLAHGLCGSAASAGEAADALLATLARLPYDRTRLVTLAVGAELAYLAGSVPLGQALEPLLAPFAPLHAVLGNAAGYWGSVWHALGFVAAAQGQGRRQDAIRHFERAQAAHEAMRSPPWSKRSAEAAAALRRSGRRLQLVS